MLMYMLIEQNGEADVFAIGLIGERGRVPEFVDMFARPHKKENALVLPLPISLGRSLLQCGELATQTRSGIFS